MKRRLLYAVPVLLFLVVAGFLFRGLYLDPRKLPSALIDKPVPSFELPPIEGRDNGGFSAADLSGEGVKLVNIFASWCVPCRVEHPLINALAEEGIPVYGINYKDAPADAERWLDKLGDPYTAIGSDIDGRVGIEWGVYGVPETFVIDAEGTIRYKHVGPLQQRDVENTLRPILEHLGS